MMGTQKEIQDLDFLCNVIDAFLGDSDSSGLGENQPRPPSPLPLPRRDSLHSEGLLDGGRPPALWREHDNEVYRREDYTIPALPLV